MNSKSANKIPLSVLPCKSQPEETRAADLIKAKVQQQITLRWWLSTLQGLAFCDVAANDFALTQLRPC